MADIKDFKHAIVRQKILDAVRKDLIGPTSDCEQLNEVPTSSYITGLLYPADTDVTEDENYNDVEFTEKNFDTDGETLEAGIFEEEEPEDRVKGGFQKPSSIGVSFYVSDDVQKVNAYINWGKYYAEQVQGEVIDENLEEDAENKTKHLYERSIAMISLDISLVWVIINLLVLYLLLKKFLFKPVCKMMDERSAKIQSDLDGAAQAKADAEKMKSDYEAEIADAHSQAVEITNKAKAQAGRECDLMLENARAESAKIMKEAEKSIANEKEKAMDDAKYQIADLAILAAAKVIKKNVGGDSDRETVDEFLSEVGAAK